MLRRWARLAVFAATFATLWLVALPAFASGPLCDDRGATVIAPSPVLILPQESLVAGDAEDCDRDAQQAALHRHRAPGERIVISEADAALPSQQLRVPSSPAVGALVIVSRETPRAGVRDRVDRPPRF